MRRWEDWLRQAQFDLDSATALAGIGRFEGACFLAQQAAEKAAKALHEAAGTEAWGHAAAALLRELQDVPDAVADAGRRLDKHYIPSRYPNTHPQGAPGDLYTRDEAERALADALMVIEHARRRLPPP